MTSLEALLHRHRAVIINILFENTCPSWVPLTA
jgi:hypothetical protein